MASEEEKHTFRNTLVAWFLTNGRTFPWRRTEDPYAILVAEILLHRTYAGKVVPAFTKLLDRFPHPGHLAKASEEELVEIVRPLGFLYRARVLKGLGCALMERFHGVVPDDARKLKEIPGVGDYTANAVLCFAYRHPVPIVDRNVTRLYQRIFGLPPQITKGPTKAVWRFAEKLLDRQRAREFNWALLDFAALVCKDRDPICANCALSRLCASAANGKGRPVAAPKPNCPDQVGKACRCTSLGG